MPPMPFPMPPLFVTAVKDICVINTFEKLLKILFSEVYCWYFGFTTLVFRNYNWYVSIWIIKFVSPLTTHISLFSSSPTRRPWCSNKFFGFWWNLARIFFRYFCKEGCDALINSKCFFCVISRIMSTTSVFFRAKEEPGVKVPWGMMGTRREKRN